MYNRKQVLRFVNNYKAKDLYLIGNEMNKRIDTGNYDSERTKFNVHYKDINKSNLYQEVKSILKDRNIEYSHKTKTNILNGVTFTSDLEFFMTLGLPFKESNRIYQSGNKKGQNIIVPDIKSKDDIPSEVTKYFDCCVKFLEDLVGKNSFANIQDKFNKYITSCGFKLDRGNIGYNKIHQTKLEYKINELKLEVNNLYINIEDYNN